MAPKRKQASGDPPTSSPAPAPKKAKTAPKKLKSDAPKTKKATAKATTDGDDESSDEGDQPEKSTDLKTSRGREADLERRVQETKSRGAYTCMSARLGILLCKDTSIGKYVSGPTGLAAGYFGSTTQPEYVDFENVSHAVYDKYWPTIERVRTPPLPL